MIRKFSLIAISVLCFCFVLTSCYPDLSVQQYNELKDDLEVLNHQSAALVEENSYLTGENEILTEENEAFKANEIEIKKYLDFMNIMFATQNSESQLNGEFDVEALVNQKEALLSAADNLTDSNIFRYISVIDAENEVGTMGAYYQALSTCLKNIKQKLGATPSSVSSNSSSN